MLFILILTTMTTTLTDDDDEDDRTFQNKPTISLITPDLAVDMTPRGETCQ